MDDYDMEPSAADLAAIESEWPLIEADLAVLDAEIAALSHAVGPAPLDWRRLRRSRRRLLAGLGHRAAAGDGPPPAGPRAVQDPGSEEVA
jgi:hypothetical protein